MILTNARLITFWGKDALIDGALIALEGKTIVDFGKIGRLAERYEDPDTVDVGGRVVMPGLVNLDGQLHHSLTRGLPKRALVPIRYRDPLGEIAAKIERALNPDDLYWSALVGLLDSVRAGVTMIASQHATPGAAQNSLDAMWRAFAEVGVRGALSYVVSDRDGEDAAQAALAENRRFVQAVRQDRSDMMRGLVGLDRSSGLSETTLRKAAELAEDLQTPLHLRLGEFGEEISEVRARYGKSPVARASEAGALRPMTLVGHGVHLEADDYRVLKESRTWVVHCPQANAASAAGTANLKNFREARVPVGLGTAGLSADIMDQVRSAVLQQRGLGSNPLEARELAARAAFNGGPHWASSAFGPPVGRLQPGARADLIVVDYDPATPLNRENLVDHLIWGVGRAPIHTVIINGKIVFREGEFRDLDERRIRARARETARDLWSRI